MHQFMYYYKMKRRKMQQKSDQKAKTAVFRAKRDVYTHK